MHFVRFAGDSFKLSAVALLLLAWAATGCYVKRTVPVLGTPTEVAVSAANRRLTVAWREVVGAAGYKVAVRPKNELIPTWREYAVLSSPYTIGNIWAMSGLAYEVRVAAVDARGRSEWSVPVSITAPVLQAAPADAIDGPASLWVGQSIVVASGHHPFANRSPWHWFLCSADGLDCKVLPEPQGQKTWRYFMEPVMQGRRVSVQVDYDKEGVSYSATKALGIVDIRVLKTHLYDLEIAGVQLRSQWDYMLRSSYVRGGAIAPLGNNLLVVEPHGRFSLIRPSGEVVSLKGSVPMNKAELLAYPDKENFRLDRFQVTDLLLKRHSAGRYELFVSHHYFTGECIRFRLSATMLLHRGADVSVSLAWRTIFDAEPCLRRTSVQAGGRMVADGRDHLWLTTGPHLDNEVAQDPASHFGKLIRVEIETGRSLILASGLRNPQGLTWDGEHLWGTDHGPRGGDELNLLELGGNYGWPLVSYGVGYFGEFIGPRTADVGSHDGFVKPVFSWVPSIGISNVIVNDERLLPLWKDDLLIGSLSGTEGSGNALFRVRRDGTDMQYVERIALDDHIRLGLGVRIRDLTQMPDGRIALLIDGGRVCFLRPRNGGE